MEVAARIDHFSVTGSGSTDELPSLHHALGWALYIAKPGEVIRVRTHAANWFRGVSHAIPQGLAIVLAAACALGVDITPGGQQSPRSRDLLFLAAMIRTVEIFSTSEFHEIEMPEMPTIAVLARTTTRVAIGGANRKAREAEITARVDPPDVCS
jgi:hypothetical protein